MLKKILKHRLVSMFSLASILFSVGGFIWAYVVLKSALGTGPLILHFNDIQGITLVGGLGLIVFMGILGIVVMVMNSFIAIAFDERDGVLGKLVAVMTLVFSSLLFMGFASIIAVN